MVHWELVDTDDFRFIKNGRSKALITSRWQPNLLNKILTFFEIKDIAVVSMFQMFQWHSLLPDTLNKISQSY